MRDAPGSPACGSDSETRVEPSATMSGASDEPERPSEVRIVGSYYFETGFLLLLASFRISCDKLFEITTLF